MAIDTPMRQVPARAAAHGRQTTAPAVAQPHDAAVRGTPTMALTLARPHDPAVQGRHPARPVTARPSTAAIHSRQAIAGVSDSARCCARSQACVWITALLAAPAALSQTAQGSQQQLTLQPVLVQERSGLPRADFTGFGDLPLKDTPISATVVNRAQMLAAGARRLADLTQFDAALSDAYNAPGYWDFLTVRGFALDNRFNYRRDGLPISAETSIPLDNKERVEVLKGTSGIQAGTSAPGGLVNYVVKRPTQGELRELRLELSARGNVLAAADLGGRFGPEQAFGYRLNLAAENLQPLTRKLDGQRSLLALAADWRSGGDTLLELEIESSHKVQPSQQGYSLLGNALPAVVDPRLNLNNQPWSQPSVFDALTGTIRFEQAIGRDWRWSAQFGRQELKTDDRLAYGFGCSDANGLDYYADRFCPNGDYDLWDFRSENERRMQQAAHLSLKGRATWGSTRHDLALGLLASAVRQRFQMQAFNYVGTGNVDGSALTAPDPTLREQNTNRDERALELSLHDSITWNERLRSWVGLRHTRLRRDSVRTDGSSPTGYSDQVTTPWLALSYAVRPGQLAYASYGQGIESQVVPNKAAQFSNPGVALPVLTSRQWELGWKWDLGARSGRSDLGGQVALFRIERPMTNLDACTRLGLTPCLGAFDGEAVHSGLETSVHLGSGPWRVASSLSLINARRQNSVVEPASNGEQAANVPSWVLRTQAAWHVTGVPGLELQASLSHEGRRNVLPDGSITLPGWTRADAVLQYATRLGPATTTWTAGIDNLFDARYWKESPFQFGHVYLFPGSARTWRLGLQAAF